MPPAGMRPWGACTASLMIPIMTCMNTMMTCMNTMMTCMNTMMTCMNTMMTNQQRSCACLGIFQMGSRRHPSSP